jgi:hypothetical protein
MKMRPPSLWLSIVLLGFPGLARADWFKGNTHTHTLNSDGNAAPDVVARWYREHGYNFVVITDHNFLTGVAALNGTIGAEKQFLIMRGEEVTQVRVDPTLPEKRRQVHLNAINPTGLVLPLPTTTDATVAQLFTHHLAAIRAAGGLPQINHPNWRWYVRADDLREIDGPVLLEIWNGQPHINNLGGADDSGQAAPSVEGLWDLLLSQGKIVWGVADDDSHHFYQPEDPTADRPGQAWIVVRADELTAEKITAALAHGEFYASNGPVLVDYAASKTEVAITLKAVAQDRFTTRFIGQGGRVLAEVPGLKPRYQIRGDEAYVRATITDSNGRQAWTQPVFLDGRQTAREK